MSNKERSYIAEMFADFIEEDKYTIEKVPAFWREKTQTVLEERKNANAEPA